MALSPALTHDAKAIQEEIKNGEPFLFDVDDMNNAGACSKACCMALGWLLNHACSKSPVQVVVLNKIMPGGRIRQFGIGPSDMDEDLVFPWQ